MDLDHDELRRSLREARIQQDDALAATAQLLDHVMSGDAGLDQSAKAAMLLGPLGRRRFLTIGAFSVGMAAVVAACGGATKKDPVPQAGLTESTLPLATGVVTDVVLLRTASSLEYNAIAAYDAAIGLGILDPAVVDAAKLFQSQHREHARFFEQATTDAGGQAFTTENPVVKAKVIDPALAAITGTPGDKLAELLGFAYALEMVAAGTYQTLVPALSVAKLRAAAISVGGVEARHAAILAAVMGGLAVPELASAASTAPTTTVAGSATPAAVAPKVFQVPAPFSPLSATQIVLGGKLASVEVLGPNSFAYDKTK